MSTPLRNGFFSTHLFKACMVIIRAHFSARSGQAAPQRRPKCSASSRLACSCSPHQKKALARTQTSGSGLKYFSRTYTSAPLRFPFHSVNDVCPSALLRELRPPCAAMLAKTLRRSLSLSKCAARVQLFWMPNKAYSSAKAWELTPPPFVLNKPSAPLRFPSRPAMNGAYVDYSSAFLRDLRSSCVATTTKMLRSLAARVQLFWMPKTADSSYPRWNFAQLTFMPRLTSAPLRFLFRSAINGIHADHTPAVLRALRSSCAAVQTKSLRSLAARVQLLAAPEKGPYLHTNLRVGVAVFFAHTYLRASAVPFPAVLMPIRLL